MKGKIEFLRKAVVSCAKCDEVEVILEKSRRQVETELRIQGWSEPKKIGWLCPGCSEDRRIARMVANKNFYGRFTKGGVEWVKSRDGTIRLVGKVAK